jgi:hypothetical protein
MKITYDKTITNQLLFIFCVVVPFFNNYELSFAVWALAILMSIKNNYSYEFLKYWIYFVVIFFLAIVVGVFYKHHLYFIIRDITYLLKPVCGLLLGYQLYSKNIKKPFQFLVYAGVAIAVYHLIICFHGILFLGAKNVREIREHGGYFNDFEVYTLIILLFHKQLKLGFSKQKNLFFIVILTISSFFYLARTNFIQFVVLYMAMKGLWVVNKKSLLIIGTIITLTILGYTAVYMYNPVRNGKGLDEFLYKIKMAPGEAFSTKINREDWKDFNDNYRSYENIRTVEQLSTQKSLIFGQGIGAQVNLKQKVMLGDMQLQYISILHNGYMTVLLKTGLVGVFIFLFTIFFFFKKNIYNNETLINIHYLFVGTGVFLIISNWVFMGFYNLIDTKSLLIGFLFAYKNELIKNLKND